MNVSVLVRLRARKKVRVELHKELEHKMMDVLGDTEARKSLSMEMHTCSVKWQIP